MEDNKHNKIDIEKVEKALAEEVSKVEPEGQIFFEAETGELRLRFVHEGCIILDNVDPNELEVAKKMAEDAIKKGIVYVLDSETGKRVPIPLSEYKRRMEQMKRILNGYSEWP